MGLRSPLLIAFVWVASSLAATPDQAGATAGERADRREPAAAASTTAHENPAHSTASESAADGGPRSSPGATAVKGELARQAANPAAPLTQIQLRNILVPDVPGTDGVTNLLQIQPVVPIGPFDWFRAQQIVRLTIQIPSLPEPVDASGLGDLELFDLVTFKTSWGHLGVGPYLVFPTAASDDLGAGTYQAGPAVAVIYSRRKLTAGAVLQNPVSFAGDSERPDVNQLIIAPTLTFGLSGGWFAGLSDFNWTFDWEDHGAATIPVGLQVGKIVTVGRQPVNVALEIGRAVARPTDTPDPGWIIGIEVSPLFNWHLGPGKKIRLQGKTAD